jgi:hypothetical protein
VEIARFTAAKNDLDDVRLLSRNPYNFEECVKERWAVQILLDVLFSLRFPLLNAIQWLLYAAKPSPPQFFPIWMNYSMLRHALL